jgi:hypothetical protein
MSGLVPDSLPIPMPLASDVFAFFSERKVKHDCPICGNGRWNLFTVEPDKVGTVVLVLEMNGGTFNHHLRLLTLICTNCAFVRQHLLNTFLEWLKTRSGGLTS